MLARKLLLIGAGLFLSAAAWAAPSLSVGTVSGDAGTTVSLPISFDPTTSQVAGLQFNLTLPASVSTVSVTAGTILNNAGKSVTASKNGSTWTFIIFGLNQNTIASGQLLTAQLQIAAGTPAGSLSIPISGAVFTDPSGQSVPGGTSTGGTITVTSAPPPPPAAPVITSPGTASGTVGTAFSYQIVATNSPTSFGATGLPAGLSVNTGNGLISGTPTAAGTSNITLSATNTGGTDTQALTLTISAASVAPTLAVGNASGQAGTAVNIPITFNPGSTSVAGLQFNLTLPAGLSTGTVTPGAILNAAGKSVTANLNGNVWTFIVFGLNQNTISNGTLVTVQLQISAATPAGSLTLPISGVSYTDPNGIIIPTGASTNGTITVTAAPPPPPAAPVITSPSTATGTRGTAFNYQIVATNSPTSFGATGLPAGLTVNTGNGLISGTPTSSGTTSVTLSATNAGGTDTQTLTLTINAPAPAAPTLTFGTVTGAAGTSVNLPVTFNPGSGSVAGIQFNVTLPTGLTAGTITPGAVMTNANKSASSSLNGNVLTVIVFGLNQTTMASGSLMTIQISIAANTTTGAKTLAVSAVSYSDPAGQTITPGTSTNGTVNVTAGAPSAPVITSPATASGNLGSAFSYQIAATNNPTSYGASGLPAGLTINAATGLISGTPTAIGTSNVTLTATNASGTGTQALTLTISNFAPYPDPDLSSIPKNVALNQSLGLANGPVYANVFVVWTFVPDTTPIPTQRAGAAQWAPTAVPPIQTLGTRTAGLSTYGLTTGRYTLRVQVVDQNNPAHVSSIISKSINVVMSDFSGLRVFPNPWRSDRHSARPQVTFENLPLDSSIKIFTVSGHHVSDVPLSADPSIAIWPFTNSSGDKVASGIYVYLIKAGGGEKKTGQIVIIK